MWTHNFSVLLIILLCNEAGNGYLVGAGLNTRFGQLRTRDTKYQVLRLKMLLENTKAVVYNCLGDASACERALAKIHYLASKNFVAVAKSVVLYVLSQSRARPSGYVGVPVFCHDTKCIIDVDPPPQVEGGCQQLISCGGNQTWNLTAAPPNTNRYNRYG